MFKAVDRKIVAGKPKQEKMTTLFVVRHGQTEWNRDERFRGRYDIPLNETGFAQARATGQRMAEMVHPGAILTSPLARAQQTAQAIASRFGLTAQIEPGLIDIDYGLWQGLSAEEASQKWPEQINFWLTTPSKVTIPDGESPRVVRRRIKKTMYNIYRRFPNETVIAVSHLVVIRLLLLSVLGIHTDRLWDLGQEPCAINRIEITGEGTRITSINDTCHLKGTL
jgi:broad specificity phosphatase PhoE